MLLLAVALWELEVSLDERAGLRVGGCFAIVLLAVAVRTSNEVAGCL